MYAISMILLLWFMTIVSCDNPFGLRLQYDYDSIDDILADDESKLNDGKHPLLLQTDSFNMPQWLYPGCALSDDNESQYCVYTCTNCGGGRGITFITTPERASVLIEGVGFTSQQINGSGTMDVPFSTNYISNNKNRGLRAEHFIPAGTLISSESPMVIYDQQMWYDIEHQEDRTALKTLAIESLPEKARQAALELHGWPRRQNLGDKLNTNAYSFTGYADGDESEQVFAAVHMNISKVNHDCRANAAGQFDWDAFAHHLYAVRDIAAGEEITISYFDTRMPQGERQRLLESDWGFKCACKTCKAAEDLVDISNSRVDEILDLEEKLSDEFYRPREAPAMAELLVTLYKEERLDLMIWRAYKAAAFEHNRAGNMWHSRAWGHKGIESGYLAGAQDELEYQDLHNLMTSPKSHWTWSNRN